MLRHHAEAKPKKQSTIVDPYTEMAFAELTPDDQGEFAEANVAIHAEIKRRKLRSFHGKRKRQAEVAARSTRRRLRTSFAPRATLPERSAAPVAYHGRNGNTFEWGDAGTRVKFQFCKLQRTRRRATGWSVSCRYHTPQLPTPFAIEPRMCTREIDVQTEEEADDAMRSLKTWRLHCERIAERNGHMDARQFPWGVMTNLLSHAELDHELQCVVGRERARLVDL